MEDKFFSLEEVSRQLKISKSTLYKLSQRKKIPSIKIGKQLRFRKSSLDKWLAKKEGNYSVPADKSSSSANDASDKKAQAARCILLIDDDQLVLKTLSRFLEGRGYNVEPAASGEEALGKLEKLNFDLLITDIRMPGIDGIETINRIREFNSRNNRPSVPEIIITGYIDTEAQRQAESLGITDYVYKPFIINDFIKSVEKKIGFSENN